MWAHVADAKRGKMFTSKSHSSRSGFTSDWMKKWREICYQSFRAVMPNHSHFDAQLTLKWKPLYQPIRQHTYWRCSSLLNRYSDVIRDGVVDRWTSTASVREWKHLELLHSSHSVLCTFVLQVGRRLLFWFFLEYTLLCKQTWNSCDTFLSGDAVLVFKCLRPRVAHFAREIYKRRFYIENASNVFRPHYTGGIWKRKNHRSVGFVSQENWDEEITWLSLRDYRFRNVFRPH